MNIRGINDAGKIIILEAWADRNLIDIICRAETKVPHSSVWDGDGEVVDEEKVRGNWRWYISKGVDIQILETVAKLKKEEKKVPAEVRKASMEYIGVAIGVTK